MKLSMNNLIIVLTYVVNTVTAAVKFKVICAPFDHGGTGVNVNIDGTSYPMQSYKNDILYEYEFEGTPSKYYYEIIGVPQQSESVLFGGATRTWDPNSTTTLYEVYGRLMTLGDDIIQTLPRIAEPLEGYDKYSSLFQEGVLPVVNVHMSDENYNHLVTITQNTELNFKIEFDLFTPYEEYHFTNATFDLSGQGSKTKNKKPYKIDLSGDETDKSNSEIFKRKEFKLRSLYFDNSYIKNKLATDVAQSIGLPVTQSILCRLYINNKSYGLYELSDLYKKKFIKNFFNPPLDTEQKAVLGTLYKGVSSLDGCDHNLPAYFYSEPDERIRDLYECVVEPTAGYDSHQDVKTLISWLEKLPSNASKQQIEEMLDLDMLLKNAALEYLICHWDGFLGNGNNFLLYAEPNNGKYHLFSYDFDLTFGIWCDTKAGDFDTYVTTYQKEGPYDCNKSERNLPLLYTKILSNPEVKPLLNNVIKDIIENLFNTSTLERRIDYYYKYYKDDMYWDIFCRNNIVKTQSFGDSNANPTIQDIENEYNGLGEDFLHYYINERLTIIAEAYGVDNSKPAVTEGKYGTVGGKLMTIGSASDDKDDKNKENDEEKLTSSSILSSNYSLPLIYTLISFLFVFIL